MATEDQIKRLNQLVEKLFGLEPRTLLGTFSPPFDTSRPNIHDSKKDFLLEFACVESTVDNLTAIIDAMFKSIDDEDQDHISMVERLSAAIEYSAWRKNRNKTLSSARDLAVQNITVTGFHYSSLLVIVEMQQLYYDRLQELKAQKSQFWSVSHRAPNYYPRTIALRFARLYADQKRAKPTFGTSSEGSHPSTEFGRALEEVFQILLIKANLRKAAEYAIDQLEVEGWRPRNALAGIAMGNYERYSNLPPGS